jgi:hypothetical protein
MRCNRTREASKASGVRGLTIAETHHPGQLFLNMCYYALSFFSNLLRWPPMTVPPESNRRLFLLQHACNMQMSDHARFGDKCHWPKLLSPHNLFHPYLAFGRSLSLCKFRYDPFPYLVAFYKVLTSHPQGDHRAALHFDYLLMRLLSRASKSSHSYW